jgi:uncharacterized protein
MLTTLMGRTGFWLAVVGAVVALVVAGGLLGWTAEWLWFRELGHEQVFWRMRLAQGGLFGAAFVAVSAYAWINGRVLVETVLTGFPAAAGWLNPVAVKGALVVAPAVAGLFFAAVFSTAWDEFLLFRFGGEFGQVDPVLGREVGFFVFTLPFVDAAQNVALSVAVLGLSAHLAVYNQLGAFRDWRTLDAGLRRRLLRTLGANAVFLVLAWGWGYYLDRFELFFQSQGTVFGPGYVDVNFVMPGLGIMIGASFALIVAIFAGMWLSKLQLPLLGIGAYAVLAGLVLVAVPGFFQHFVVTPNELVLEEPFLGHNIAFTRRAFGLDRVKEESYPAVTELTLDEAIANGDTLRNVRLWDWRPLLRTYRQLQEIRLYYRFHDIDVDRYPMPGGVRQVLLSARELAPALPDKAETWLNHTLQYTHGYGVAMSLATHEDPQGIPTLVVKDLPPEAGRGPRIDRPAIYYGENMPGYRIVNTSIKELDYPRGDANVYTSYAGGGGVQLSSFWRRLLFAWNRFDINIVISSYVTPNSRIQLWRNVKQRVKRIAPFLRLDSDPYLVIHEGRLVWIQDAYTVSGSFPYSEPHEAGINYIRNSVKVVIDAYEGSVDFFAMDSDDPILAAYTEAFPGLFKPLDGMAPGLRAHLRYPRDLFGAQVRKYRRYHMRIPQVFYNNEDLWTLAREKYGGKLAPMKPYYILMRLPGEERLEFLLMSPLTPENRDNMIAWMAARSDFPGYGDLIVYKFPKERLIYGPLQIEALVDQDTLISRQLSLWDQRGSRVIRGNLIAIPLNHSLLYVEPVYLIAELNDVPQLKRVIVAHGGRVAMEPTLDAALRVVLGGATPTPPSTTARGGVLSGTRDLFERAQRALEQGNWPAFGVAMGALKQFLDEAEGKAAE